MTITNGYATLAEFKAYVTVRGGSTSTDAADDAVIEDLIEAVSRQIDNLTGRRFVAESSDSTRYFEAKDGKCEIDELSTTPTSISVDYSGIRTYTALTAADYELLPDNASAKGLPYDAIIIAPASSAYFPEGRKGVKIIGKFGWPSVPDNIKSGCLAVCHNWWMERSGQASSGKVTVTASGVVIRPEDIPPHVMSDLLSLRVYR